MNSSRVTGWRKLDNAAKIFPSATSKADTKVFRFAVELNEPIDRYLLQDALDRTLEDFSGFCCVLKRGLFWYYLEEVETRFLVHEEDSPPCRILYQDSRSPLFDVSYYRCRINVEVYHVLTDGAGALQFLKTLTYYYLRLAHKEALQCCSPLDFDASAAQRADDSFAKYFTGSKPRKAKLIRKLPPIYSLRGPKTAEHHLKILEGVVPVDRLLACARERNVSATALLTAVLMRAIYEEMSERDKKKIIAVSIPVNLHKYFPSQTVRNFFSVVNIGYCFDGASDKIEDIAASVRDTLANTLNSDYLQQRLDTLAAVEHWMIARVIPLFIKNIVLKRFYLRSEREYTTTISNVGQVVMPLEMAPYIHRFDVFNSTKDLQACLCSYGNLMAISFTSQLLSNDIERRFFRMLTAMGIEVQLIYNRFEGMGEKE